MTDTALEAENRRLRVLLREARKLAAGQQSRATALFKVVRDLANCKVCTIGKMCTTCELKRIRALVEREHRTDLARRQAEDALVLAARLEHVAQTRRAALAPFAQAFAVVQENAKSFQDGRWPWFFNVGAMKAAAAAYKMADVEPLEKLIVRQRRRKGA